MRRLPDTLNDYLRLRRDDTKYTNNPLQQADIALALGVSQSLISKIERGLSKLDEWEPHRLYELLLAYKVPPALQLELADSYHIPTLKRYIVERQQTARVGEGKRVRFLGSISAGKLGENQGVDPGATVSVPDVIAERYRLEDVFAVNVIGDSMVCADARNNIPPGSLAYFHTRLSPEEGEVVCIYLEQHDLTVIKRWRPKEGYAVLSSHNPKHEPIIVRDEDEGMLQGVYLTHVPETPRLR